VQQREPKGQKPRSSNTLTQQISKSAANQHISKSANQQQDENFLESAGAEQTSSASVFVLLY
jgi:hypothetical protein